jgi:plastocyanin
MLYMKNRLLSVPLVLCLASFAVSAGDDAAALVYIKDFKFVPQHITIKAGQTITWENREKRQYHSVWFEALDEAEPEDYLFPEDIYERSFDKSGTFPYRCGPHPEMTGSVTVTE